MWLKRMDENWNVCKCDANLCVNWKLPKLQTRGTGMALNGITRRVTPPQHPINWPQKFSSLILYRCTFQQTIILAVRFISSYHCIGECIEWFVSVTPLLLLLFAGNGVAQYGSLYSQLLLRTGWGERESLAERSIVRRTSYCMECSPQTGIISNELIRMVNKRWNENPIN